MFKKTMLLLLLTGLLILLKPDAAMAASEHYTDVPIGHWSMGAVNAARDYGLMQGNAGAFGFGDSISRAEFITVLVRMFDWTLINPDSPSFSDVQKDQWYYTYIETALKNNVLNKTQTLHPKGTITREEMAVMLVRSLGYQSLAQSVSTLKNPFMDVSAYAGYITLAYDIGMTKGTSATTFSPKLTAKREEAAVMLVRIYEKYIGETTWVHGFYAISSYAQKELTKDMDAVSTGWSRMTYSLEKGAILNTSTANGNEYYIPTSYEDIISYLRSNKTKTHLSVYMDTSTTVATAKGDSNPCSAILLDAAQRTQAVNAITNELMKNYNNIGYNPYSGVTIDFEGMKGSALKAGYNAFLQELSAALKPLVKTLYVTVQPATEDGIYYDAYDFRTIGKLADKIILMAHDYHETIMPENLLGSSFYKNTPLTPFSSVYYALRAITDETTGVEEPTEIALAISFASVGWEIQNQKIVNATSVSPAPSTIDSRLKNGAVMGYSELYRNPYITYKTEDGKEIFLWYEDERSVRDKLQLAKLFGINGVSLWRLGNIPNDADERYDYNVMKSIRPVP